MAAARVGERLRLEELDKLGGDAAGFKRALAADAEVEAPVARLSE